MKTNLCADLLHRFFGTAQEALISENQRQSYNNGVSFESHGTAEDAKVSQLPEAVRIRHCPGKGLGGCVTIAHVP